MEVNGFCELSKWGQNFYFFWWTMPLTSMFKYLNSSWQMAVLRSLFFSKIDGKMIERRLLLMLSVCEISLLYFRVQSCFCDILVICKSMMIWQVITHSLLFGWWTICTAFFWLPSNLTFVVTEMPLENLKHTCKRLCIFKTLMPLPLLFALA